MLSIFQQNIEKRYFVPILSRGFFIAALCYLIAFIVPVLILVSIGYSWIQDSKILLKPIIKYQNYQLTCLMADQSSIYDSSFSDQPERNYLSSVSVGSDSSIYSIGAYVQGSILSCTIMTYNKILLNDNYQILVTIPFSFYHSASNISSNKLNKISQRGKIQVFSTNYLLDTAVPFQQTNYKTTNDFSMVDNTIAMSNKNLSAYINVGTQKKQYGINNGFEFVGSFQIEGQLFVKSQSLLNKIRSFIPFYMFLWFPIFFFLIVPIVQWMFSSKLYYAKSDKNKIKLE